MESSEEEDYEEGFEDEEDDIPKKKKHNRLKQCLQCLNWVTFQWIKTPVGFLKLFQFGTLLMGLIMIGAVTSGERVSMEFFVFVTTSAWVFVFIIVVMNILDVYQKLPKVLTNNLMLFIGCGKQNMLVIFVSKRFYKNIYDNSILFYTVHRIIFYK